MTEGLKQRIKTAFIIGVPILFLVFFNDTTRRLFLLLMIALTMIEFLGLHYGKPSNKTLLWISSIGIALVMTVLTYLKIIPSLAVLVCGGISTLFLLFYLYKGSSYGQEKWSWISALLFTTFPICTLLYQHAQADFKYILIGVLLLIWISDISAYFVGKSIGKHKLMPSVSPGKTKEGFLGAGMITMIFSYLIYNLLGYFTFQQWTVIALLVWLMGSIGDLVESKMKRQLGIKDSGNILPGHGGFLDRFDGFIFCLPAVNLFVYLISR